MRRKELIDTSLKLLSINSVTELEDTTEIMEYIKSVFRDKEQVTVHSFLKDKGVENLIIEIHGLSNGKTISFNGHVDTFPIGEINKWKYNPFGELFDNKYIYGRGAADMKCAIAAIMQTLLYMHEHRNEWKGTIKGIFVGDEQVGGSLGTKFLLADSVEWYSDALVNGDMGSPYIIRFGEKGLVWIKLDSFGKSGHGAYVFDNDSAIEKILLGIEKIKIKISEIEGGDEYKKISKEIMKSEQIFKYHSMHNEIKTLNTITCNIGKIEGGNLVNLSADKASALIDIRVPCGYQCNQIINLLDDVCNDIKGLQYSIVDMVEPNYTDPESDIIKIAKKCCKSVLGDNVTASCRVGASDSVYFRKAGIPTVNCGLRSHGAGEYDEYIEIQELEDLFDIYTKIC